ncbi:hypothetical protein [Nocardioides jensenii]|uniref:hypothetical protein n=1 Tax=Nocardioides jensenii TaxID=1843 RepID=UPI000836B09E|nr:hypothetical protein [Nocardioides jensenii]
MRVTQIRAATVAALLALALTAGCGGNDKDEKGSEGENAADVTQFCEAFTALDPAGDFEAYRTGVAALASGEDDEALPANARTGFGLHADIVDVAFTMEGAEAMTDDLTAAESAQLTSFNEFVDESC